MTKLPFMPVYVDDIMVDPKVQAMDSEQFAWYVRMLFQAWRVNPPSLKNVEQDLMDAAGCADVDLWQAKKGKVMRCWDISPDGLTVSQKRQCEEHQKALVKYAERSESGKRGADSRWKKAELKLSHAEPSAIDGNRHRQEEIHTPKTKPSRASQAKASDPRREEFVKALDGYWKHLNPSVDFTMGAADNTNLNRFLRDHPKVTLELFRKCLWNRARSPGVRKAAAVNRWILDLLEHSDDRANTNQRNQTRGDSIREKNAESERELEAALEAAHPDSEQLPSGSEHGRPFALADPARKV